MAKIEVLDVDGAIVLQWVTTTHNMNSKAIPMTYAIANQVQHEIRELLTKAGVTVRQS